MLKWSYDYLGFQRLRPKPKPNGRFGPKRRLRPPGPTPNKEANCKEQEMSLLDNSPGRKGNIYHQLTQRR